MGMKIEQYVVGMIGTNCYFIINDETKETLVIDPGGHGRELAQQAQEKGYEIQAILLTHGHCDHTDGIEALRDALRESDIKVYALDKEEAFLNDPRLNESSAMGYGNKSYPADVYLHDGQSCTMCGFTFEVIATPGHTPGGCCFYFKEESCLFSGDTLFCSSVGRTDLPGGSMTDLLHSVREKLFALPDNTAVYPGHEAHTTIGREKVSNPFIR